jgi:hypothetical protein
MDEIDVDIRRLLSDQVLIRQAGRTLIEGLRHLRADPPPSHGHRPESRASDADDLADPGDIEER